MTITGLRRALTAVWVVMIISLTALAAWSHFASPIVIAGRSMEPAVPLGSLAVPSAIEPEDIVAGDIMTVRADNGVILTHRVARVMDLPEGRFLELKGDANSSPDPNLVPARAVMGRVDLQVPYAGFVLALLSMPSGLVSVLCALGALLVGIWLLEDFEGGVGRTVDSGATARAAHGNPA